MTRPKPLFVMGSKRSGTTLFTNLVNYHSRLFVSHESDIIWILYQSRNGLPDRFRIHPLDVEESMNSTLVSCGDLLKKGIEEKPTREQLIDLFYDVQTRLVSKMPDASHTPLLRGRLGKRLFAKTIQSPRMRKLWTRSLPFTSRIRKRAYATDLEWIGDKKHLQHLDPEIRPFIADLFPDARYIHLIRHPRGVLGSFEKAVQEWPFVPEYWKTSREELFDAWARHEEWVLQNKEEAPGRVETVRLEDLVVHPIETMERIFDFLGLDMPGKIAETIATWDVRASPNRKYASLELPNVPRAKRIMELYEYDLAS